MPGGSVKPSGTMAIESFPSWLNGTNEVSATDVTPGIAAARSFRR